ncbi:hypothetical protein PsYK624_099630 [Phanerochaete sordida]|uniref:Uncharacterized protein n=1 Tax=Phanerochaete sordida TaxID=48140 RepID=A0A9P3GF61_9APHY|nr:hypothetical protein PsYK624_099630 [Phanerochaete sordida]
MPLPLSAQPPSLLHQHKRPRGLWRARCRDTDPYRAKSGSLSHDVLSDTSSDLASTSSRSSVETAFDDECDDDDARSSSSSTKRRRLSGALSDSETLCQLSPSSRALTPDLGYHASLFPPTHPLNYLPPYLFCAVPSRMHDKDNKFASINSKAKGKRPTTADIEDWENLKELFARASEAYEADDIADALPLLRAVIRECHRFLVAHPDPSVIYTGADPSAHDARSPDILTPTEDRLRRDWTPESLSSCLRGHRPNCSTSSTPLKASDPPTAFHALFGTALYYMGTLVAQDSGLALPDEPATPSTYWLAALDVFETGENLPSVLATGTSVPEDWRMCISWGRTLVCLADEKLAQSERTPHLPPMPSPADLRTGYLPYQPSLGAFSALEPRWPPNSPFHAIAAARPPVTRRMSLFSASAHDVMVLAMDQFSRGIFHMPHRQYAPSHNPSALQLEFPYVEAPGFGHARRHSSPSSLSSSSAPTFSRPKELFTIASELLGVAERLSQACQREYWASQADSVFNQMKMEADMGAWRMAVNAARGRCWLVVGEARAEEIESALERGDTSVLHTVEAAEAREGLATAVAFLERAKGSATARPDPEQEDLSPLLAEALLTLANLTADEDAREKLYARAQSEGGDAVQLELDPPSRALPAAITSIAAAAKSPVFSAPPPVHKIGPVGVPAGARTISIEATPSLMFGAGAARRSSLSYGHAPLVVAVSDVAMALCGQAMVVDGRRDEGDMRMDES